MEKKTFEEISKDKAGTLYHDEIEEGVRFIVIRGPSHLCAYVGIPTTHPLAGFNYDLIPITCHGGLTFGGEGDDKYRPKGYFWYGWDYGHSGDYSFYYDKESWGCYANDKKWTVEEVVEDSWDAIYDFQRLVKLAEGIYSKAKQ